MMQKMKDQAFVKANSDYTLKKEYCNVNALVGRIIMWHKPLGKILNHKIIQVGRDCQISSSQTL